MLRNNNTFEENLKAVLEFMQIPSDKVVVTYSGSSKSSRVEPEGIWIWWIRSNVDNAPFKSPAFVMQTLQLQSDCWWIKEEYDLLEWSCQILEDPQNVELGADPFKMSLNEFVEYRAQLIALEAPTSSELKYPTITGVPGIVNSSTRGSNGDSIINMISNWSKAAPAPTPTTTVLVKDPDFPITFSVNGNSFNTLADAQKYIDFQKITRLLFTNFGEQFTHQESMKRFITTNLVDHKDEIIKLLKGL